MAKRKSATYTDKSVKLFPIRVRKSGQFRGMSTRRR